MEFLSKPGCHLCDEARQTLREVLVEFEDAPISFNERSILDDDELRFRYAEDIPVVLLNGSMHTFWKVDPSRLRKSLSRLLENG